MSLNKSVIFATLMLRGSMSSLTTTPETVSPVTLYSDWSRVSRLLLLTALSVIGNIGNVFMISAVMVEDHLKKKGNAFLASLALADILISGIVIPASVIVILSDYNDTDLVVCNFQWFVCLVSCLVSVLTVLLIAVENYSRLCLSPQCYSIFTPSMITWTIIFIWILSGATITIQTVYDLGPDYCNAKPHGLIEYQIGIGVGFIFIPTILTFAFYLSILNRVSAYRAIPTFTPPMSFNYDYDLMTTNLYAFLLSFLIWAPFGFAITLCTVQPVSQKLLYTLGWLAMSKSCFLNYLYCITNQHFRSAYVSLFHYCCCKTILFSKRSREPVRPLGDVRVHIIPGYNMYSYTSPQRSRDTNKSSKRSSSRNYRSGTNRSSSRDVYEL